MREETHTLTIESVAKERRWEYEPLLMLADDAADMVEKYLFRGDMFVLLADGKPVGECVVTNEGDGTAEIKSIAIDPAHQKCGYGRRLVEEAIARCRGRFNTLLVGTGDSPLTIPFYERCGFRRSHVIKNFFVDHYDHPVIEEGLLLVDMIILKLDLQEGA